jgi:hypothetical protein
MFSRLSNVWLALMLAGALVFGQAAQSSLTGTITDPSGAGVPNATVELVNKENGSKFETTSNGQGVYSYPRVSPGTYTLTVKAPSFRTAALANLQLLISTPSTQNVRLEVGAVTETVAVSADALTLNTVDASLGNTFTSTPIIQLPLEGRNASRLLSLQSGITWIGDEDVVNGGSNVSTDRNGSVNGGRSDQSNITLDGVDINDQQARGAFGSALRVTSDSVQEFRVTTTGANADSSRGSGAQMALVTRSGTNTLHGAAYWYLRNKAFNANTFFNNLSGLKVPKLNQNNTGFRLGGPVIKNKLFIFGNFEQLDRRYESSESRIVPREHLRVGTVNYTAVAGNTVSVNAQQLEQLLPEARGINQAALTTLRSYPSPNDLTLGDGINTAGFRFNSALRSRFNTYVSKIDYNLSDKHQFFVRGQLQNDFEDGAPQFPGQAPELKSLDNTKGLAVGWNAVLSSNLISNTRWGLTRQGVEDSGAQTYPLTTFRGIDSPIANVTSFRRFSPTYHMTQDFTYTKGRHSFQFGGSVRRYSNDRLNFAASFFSGNANSSWLTGSGNVISAPLVLASLPTNQRMAANARTSFHDSALAVLGLVTQVTSRYNYLPNADGTVRAQAPGEGVPRKFNGEENEVYFQDTWKITPGLTMVAGIRFLNWPAIYEANGVQTSPNISLSEWFNLRVGSALTGQSATNAAIPPISYLLANQGGRPFYGAMNNWSPRLSLAYNVNSRNGLMKMLFGDPGKTVIRAGAGIFYDVAGAGIARAYDASALGLSTSLNNASGRETLATAAKFISPTTIPQNLVSAPPPATFPVRQPNNFAITNSLDENLRAGRTMRYNLSIQRELKGGFLVTGSYVGAAGRQLLTSEDLATPTNLVDPVSKMDYFTAAKQLTYFVRQGTAADRIAPIPFWENMYPGLRTANRTPTQAAYEVFADAFPDATYALELLDRFGDPSASRLGTYAQYSPQYSYLRALRSVGMSSYNSMQWTVRKRFANADQIDFNYTWAHSIDTGSVSENNASTTDGLRGVIINPYNRRQSRGSSDFDIRHAWNANWVYNLPVGKGRRFLGGMSSVGNQILGGWQLGGIYRQSTGLPVSVGHNRTWPTNYNITGNATQIGSFVDGTNKNAAASQRTGASGPNIFQDPPAALAAFDFTDPGEIGQRNNVRGDGIFNIDLNLAKNFNMPWEGHTVQFRWETFNITNTVRFDPRNINLSLSNPAAFGRYQGTLGGPRVMQFALRYDF